MPAIGRAVGWPVILSVPGRPTTADTRSRTDWAVERGAPCLGEHNDYVFGELLGIDADELAALRADGVV